MRVVREAELGMPVDPRNPRFAGRRALARILIIDDTTANRDLMAGLLRAEALLPRTGT